MRKFRGYNPLRLRTVTQTDPIYIRKGFDPEPSEMPDFLSILESATGKKVIYTRVYDGENPVYWKTVTGQIGRMPYVSRVTPTAAERDYRFAACMWLDFEVEEILS